MNAQAEKFAEPFGLNEREVNWIRTAKAGNDEDGYSEALLGIDEEGWFPLRVRASPAEVAVIDDRDKPHARRMGGGVGSRSANAADD